MKFIESDWAMPYYNFALESYLLNHAPEDDYLFFYVHKPSIIIGKHQNTLEEINRKFVEEHDITVARRLSGGGAVYHDAGNLNFSFIKRAQIEDMHHFEKFTQPVVSALQKLGINAKLSGRNDILIDEMKISGNAQYFRNNRILSHGTLLYDADMSKLQSALNVDPLKILSKGVKSIKSRVTNIREHLEVDMTIEAFRTYMQKELIEETRSETYALTPEAHEWIINQAENHFQQWAWNWGESPECNVIRKAKFECGIIDARIDVEEGFVKTCKFFGDFFVKRDIEQLETYFIGLPFTKEALISVAEQIHLEDYFKDLEWDVFIDFLIYG